MVVALVLHLLGDSLLGHILARLPVDGAATCKADVRSIILERHLWIERFGKVVLLGEHFVGEVIILIEFKLQLVTLFEGKKLVYVLVNRESKISHPDWRARHNECQ